MNHYKKRNDILAELGFASYDSYLKSILWLTIRRTILQTTKGRCAVCNARANQVHHEKYTKGNLSGDSTDHLKPICRDCHEYIEHDDLGVKLMDMDAVAARLDTLIVNPEIRDLIPKALVKKKAVAKKRKKPSKAVTETKPSSTKLQKVRKKAERLFTQGKVRKGTAYLRRSGFGQLVVEFRQRFIPPVVVAQVIPSTTPPKESDIPFDLTPEQAAAFGVEYPLKRGWRRALLRDRRVAHNRAVHIDQIPNGTYNKDLDERFRKMFQVERPSFEIHPQLTQPKPTIQNV